MELEKLLEKQRALQQEQEAIDRQIKVAEKADEICGKVAQALLSIPEAKDLVGKSYSLLAVVDPTLDQWVVQAVPKTTPKKSGGNGEGSDGTNFRGNPVTISGATQSKYGLSKVAYDSIRELALAMGVAKEDRHPDQTLRKTFPDVWKEIKGKGASKDAKAESPTATGTDTTEPVAEQPEDGEPEADKEQSTPEPVEATA